MLKFMLGALLLVATATHASTPENAISALMGIISGNSQQDGLVLVAHRTGTARDLLRPINAYLTSQGKEPFIFPKYGKMVIVAGRPARDMVRGLEEAFGKSEASEIDRRILIFNDDSSRWILNLIKREWSLAKQLLQKEIAFITGNITYGLTMQLLKEMILMRVGWGGVLLFPFTAAADLLAVAAGLSVAILSVAINGAVILVTAAAYAIHKVISVIAGGIIKIGKWIIGKLRGDKSSDDNGGFFPLSTYGSNNLEQAEAVSIPVPDLRTIYGARTHDLGNPGATTFTEFLYESAH